MTDITQMNGQLATINASNEAGWTRKQDVARSFDVDVRTIERAVGSLTFDIDAHIQKGGYHNVEVYYDNYLVNAIGKQLKVNAMNSGGQKTEGSIIKQDNAQDLQIAEEYKNMRDDAGWTRKQDVANSFDVTVQTIDRVVNSLTCNIDVHTQKGGYHNSEVLYDDYLVNAIGMKLKANAISQGKQSEVIKRDNAQDILSNSLMKKGSPDELEALGYHLIAVAQERRQLQQSQQTIKALTDENKALTDENEALIECNVKYNNLMTNEYVNATTLKNIINSKLEGTGVVCPPIKPLARAKGWLGPDMEHDVVLDESKVYLTAFSAGGRARQTPIYNPNPIEDWIDAVMECSRK